MSRRWNSDRVVLITGAAGGIGSALAELLVTAGDRVVLLDRDLAAVKELAARLGSERALPVVADVCDPETLTEAVEQAVAAFGGLDVVVANAGITPPAGTIRSMDTATMQRVLDVNVMGVFHTARATMDELARSGGHLHISGSCSAFMPGAGGAPYMMSKAAVEQLARALRLEVADLGVTVGLSLLGIINTTLAAATLDDDPFGRGLDAMMPGPLRRRLPADDAAAAMVDQISRRRARQVIPRTWSPLQLGRGALPAMDHLLVRNTRLRTMLADLDTRATPTPTPR